MSAFKSVDPICWFELNYTDPDPLQLTLAMIELYIPLWLTIIGSSYAIYKVIASIKANLPAAVPFAKRLRYYPMVLPIAWTLPTLVVVISLILEETYDWMSDVSIVIHCSQGLLYSILFFSSGSLAPNQRPKSASITPMPGESKARGSTLDLTLETIQRMETHE